MRKHFSLIEVVGIVVIIALLCAIVYDTMKGNTVETAVKSGIGSNIRNYQTAADLFRMNEAKYPTEQQPTITTPQPIDFDLLYPDYVKKKSPRDGFYWIDGNGRTWGSLLPLVNNVILSDDKVSFDEVEGNYGYNVYKFGDRSSVTGATTISNDKLEKIGSEIQGTEFNIPEEHQGAEAYLVSAIDYFGFETAPAGEKWVLLSDDGVPLADLKPGTYYFTTNANQIATWIGWLKDDSVPKGASVHYSFATSNDNKTYSNYSDTFNVGVKAQYMRVKVVLTANEAGDIPQLNRLRVMFQTEEVFESPVPKKPFAIISMSPSMGVTPDTTVSWSSALSYSPDKKSIVDEEWKNKQSQYSEGTHTVSLRVKNSAGIWSDWVTKQFKVAYPVEAQPSPEPEVKKPIAVISYTPETELQSDTEITWDSSKSYSPDNLKIVNEEWKNKKSTYEVGQHVIQLRVQDENGNWSDWASKTIRVITPKPVAVINYLPNGTLYNDTLIAWNSSSSYSPQGLKIVDEEWKNKESSYAIGEHSVELRVQDEEGNWSEWATKGIQISAKPVIKPIAVIDYSPKTAIRSETDIVWNADKSYSPDGSEITMVEWINQKERYPVGNHIIELRVQNAKGVWSDWAKQVITVSDPVLVKPIAVITKNPATNLTPKTQIEWSHANSYSPDGLTIVAAEWENKEVKYAEGDHTVRLRVQNSAGVWSDWTATVIEVKIPKPVAIISYSPDTRLYQDTTVTWSSAKSYSPDGLEIVQEEWENKRSQYVLGNHGISLRVQNSDGVWSDWVSKTIHISEFERPVAVIEMSPSENLRSNTVITWDSSKSYDTNPTPFAIVETEWENKSSTYAEGEHEVRLRVKNAAGIWSGWTSKRFKVDSDWATIGQMNYEVDAGSEGDWLSVEIEDIQPTDTRIVYEYRSSTNGSSWSTPYKTIGEVPNSRYLKVSIISQRKEHTTSVPTFISILVNYSNTKGNQSTLINREMNLQLLQEAVDKYYLANNLYPAYTQPKEGSMQAINLYDLYPDFLNVSPENYKDTFWVDHFGQIHTSNKYSSFDGAESRIGNMMNGGDFEEVDGVIYYKNPTSPGYLFKMNTNHLSKKQVLPNYASRITRFEDTIYYSYNGKLFKLDESENAVPLNLNAVGHKNIRATADWIYAQNSSNLLNRVRPDGSDIQTYKQVNEFDVVGDWIYYVEHFTFRMKKMRLDGSEDTLLVDANVGMFTVVGEDLYYINSSERKFYKYNLTTGTNTSITDTKMYRINIVGDWVYYSNDSDNSYLYKMKLDGSENTQLNSDNTSGIHVLGDWIYYTNLSDSSSIYKIRTDGTERSSFEDVLVSENPLGTVDRHINNNNAANSDVVVEGDMVNGWIYYTDTENGSYWTKIRPDGSEKTVLSNYRISNATIVGTNVYYSYNNALHRANLDLTNSKQLSTNSPSEIMVDGDWVYYTTYRYSSHYLYRVLRNGERQTMVTASQIRDFVVKDGTVYYASANDTNKVYSVKGDGTGQKKLSDLNILYLAIEGDWLYLSENNNGIHKMKTDGSEKSVVTSKATSYINVMDGWVYYQNSSFTEKGLYKIKPDGTEEQLLAQDDVRGIDIVSDWIYYTNYSDNSRYYKIKIDGTKRYYIDANPTETPLNLTGQHININNTVNNQIVVDGNLMEDYIYYSDTENGNRWTKMLPDGGDKTFYSVSETKNPVIVGEEVYFLNANRIFVSNLDRTESKALIDASSYTILMVEGDWIYYTRYSSSRNYLYRVQRDGKNMTRLFDAAVGSFVVKDGTVYYVNASDGNKLYKVNGDGTKTTLLLNEQVRTLAIEGDWLYYTNGSYLIHKMKLDGTEKTQLSSIATSSLNVYNGWIYYSGYGSTNAGLYKMKLDGTGNQLLTGDSVSGIDVFGEWIYYANSSDNDRYYKVKTDGTKRHSIDANPTETPLGLTSQHVNINNTVNNQVFVDGNLIDGWIYYSDTENGNRWTKMLPDGSNKTAYSVSETTKPVVVGEEVYFLNANRIFVSNLDRTESKALADASSYSVITVDGDWVYFTRYTSGRTYLYRIQRDGKNLTKVLHDAIGSFIVKNGIIYYSNAANGNKLYKVNGDGTKSSLLLNEQVRTLAIEGDWLYYTNGSYLIHKMKLDGTEKTQLSSIATSSLNVYNGWIYYSGYGSTNAGLYKMKLDGTGNQLLTGDSVSGIDVFGEWIYYTNSSDNDRYYKVKTDGTNRYYIGSNPTEKPLGSTTQQVNIHNSLNTQISVDGNLVDGWVYYTDTGNGNRWTKMLPDGSSKTAISVSETKNPVVVGDKVYFLNANRVFVSNLDRTEAKALADASSYSVITVDGDWVYFTRYTSGRTYLYRVQRDGQNMTRVFNSAIGSFIVKNGIIYYSNAADGNKLYKANGDGTGEMKMADFAINNLALESDTLYMTDSQRGIIKMKMDGSNEVQLSDKKPVQLNVSDGWIYYYSNLSTSKGLYKMRVDGTGNQLLVDASIDGIDVLNEWIYYINVSDLSKYYKVKADGTGNSPM